MYDTRGSVWRKWDLQVQPIKHEWLTNIEQNSGSIKSAAQEYIRYANEKGIRVIGVTDHNSGHALDHLIENDEKVIVLPGVELDLMEGWHLTVIINPLYKDKISVPTWAETIDDFLSSVCEMKRPFHDEHGVAKKVEITTVQLLMKLYTEDIGIPIFAHCCSNDGFFKRGDKQARTEILNLFKEKKSKFIFEIKDKLDQIDYIRRKIKDWAQEDLPVPIISSTDAHQANEVGKSYSWIKADPTYEGLKQVLIEPEERLKIDSEPKKKLIVEKHKTKFIDHLDIIKKKKSNDKDIWFDYLKPIPLNYDLVAVIGNKGSGKSAFTDIVSLVGRTKNHHKFSFLSKKKFKNPRSNKAIHFEAKLKWRDGSIIGPVDLDENPEIYDNELIKYLPQNFIEDICNPITHEERKLFEKELKDVIFSWVPESERLGKASLDEIINYKSEVVNRKVDELRNKIRNVNTQILELEKKISEEYRKEVEEKLKEKQKELSSHQENRPKKVEKPQENIENDEELKAIHKNLTTTKERITLLETRQEEYQKVLRELNNRIAASDRLIKRVKMIERYIDDTKLELSDELELLGVDYDKIVHLKIDVDALEKRSDRFLTLKGKIEDHVRSDSPKSIVNKIENLKREKEKLEKKLDEPNKLYQEYLSKLEDWKKQKNTITGSESKIGSLKYLEEEIKKLEDEYIERLKSLQQERKEVVEAIHEEYCSLKEVYSSLYEPVSDFINEHKDLLEDFNLSFAVSVESKNFKEEFLNKIHLGIIGSFQGESEAHHYLTQIHDSINFNEEQQVLDFLDRIDRDLHIHRETKDTLKIEKQLKGDETPQTLYDYLYCLEYLQPTYQLKLDGKELFQLSPGERGILLLIFYLLIDRDIRPLIIDQPEENLDNETVYKVLVKCIREAKKRRQIIIVTHNPNLAVVCDAEQVIVACINKKDGNEVTYKAGSIENPEINKQILNILEGTRPAFENRDAKYLV